VGAGAQATCDGPKAAPSREARAGAAGHVAAPELPQVRRRDPESRGHVAAPELPQAESAGIGTVVHVGMRVHLVFCLDLELVCRDTRFSEYRQ
jgi:hypothetical protein